MCAGRKAVRDAELAGFSIPAGQALWVGLSSVIRGDPRWPETAANDDPLRPDRFNPDRFLSPEGGAQGSQLVFGAGEAMKECMHEPNHPVSSLRIKTLGCALIQGTPANTIIKLSSG